jgi:O-antigen/teichoic acid export membrane protein
MTPAKSTTLDIGPSQQQPGESFPVSSGATLLTLRVVQQLAGSLIGLVTGMLSARWLGPEGKGLLAVVLLVSGVMAQLATLGLHDAAPYLRNRLGFTDRELFQGFGLFYLAWGVPLGFVIALGMVQYGGYFWSYPISLFVGLVCGVLSMSRLAGLLAKGLLLSESRFRQVALIDLADGALPGLIFLVATVAYGASLTGACLSFLVASLLVASWGAALVARAHAIKGASTRIRLLSQRMRAYGTWTQLRQTGAMLMSRGDMFLVGRFLGVPAVGLYSVSVTLSEVLIRAPEAVAWMMMPRTASLADPPARAMSARYSRIIVFFLTVVSVPYLVFTRTVVAAFLPATFWPSFVALGYLLPGVVASAVVRILGADLIGRGRAGLVAWITWLSVIPGLLLDLILIPHAGIVGAALGSSIIQILAATLTTVAYSRESQIPVTQLLLVRGADLALFRRRPTWRLVKLAMAAEGKR